MIFWIDDLREPPQKEGYRWIKSVNEAKAAIQEFENLKTRNCIDSEIDYLDMDHDAGDYAYDGGDYIKLLDWLEEEGYCYDIRIHSMNIVGKLNMQRICNHNNWTILD